MKALGGYSCLYITYSIRQPYYIWANYVFYYSQFVLKGYIL